MILAWQRNNIYDVYIDDFIILCCSTEICAPVELTARFAVVDAADVELGLPVKAEQCDDGSTYSCFWGAEMRGGKALLVFCFLKGLI